MKTSQQNKRHLQYIKHKDRELRQVVKYRKTHKEQLRKKIDEYYIKHKVYLKQKSKEWYKKNKSKIFKYIYSHNKKIAHKKWRKDRVAARNAVSYYLNKGTIFKKPCEVCGNLKVQAHHYKGYSKRNRLNVKWLCSKHHGETHTSK